MNDFRRRSDKRPLAPSTASTLVYETVPGEQDPNCKKTAKPQDGENMEEHNYEQDMPNKQQSAKDTPVYEIQYKPVKIEEGLCMIQEEGEDIDNTEQCKLRDTGESNGTMGSHHSYEIIKDRQGAILESTESSLGNKQARDVDDGHVQQGGGVPSIEARRGAKKKQHGAKNVMYENVTIALSPDVRCSILHA